MKINKVKKKKKTKSYNKITKTQSKINTKWEIKYNQIKNINKYYNTITFLLLQQQSVSLSLSVLVILLCFVIFVEGLYIFFISVNVYLISSTEVLVILLCFAF